MRTSPGGQVIKKLNSKEKLQKYFFNKNFHLDFIVLYIS